MSKEAEQIRMALHSLVLRNMPSIYFTGEVTSVNESDYTCKVNPSDGGDTLHSVRLKPEKDNQPYGMVQVPENGAQVILMPLNNDPNTLCVVWASKLKKLIIKMADNSSLEFNSRNGKIDFNKGQNGGMVIIQKLVDALNRLEKRFNKLLTEFKTHIHSDPLSGTTGTLVVPSSVTNNPVTTKAELENTKVNH